MKKYKRTTFFILFCIAFSGLNAHANALYIYYVNGKKIYTNAPPSDVQAEKTSLKAPQVIVHYSPEQNKSAHVPATITQMIQTLAPKYNISPALAQAVVKAESNFNPNAVSKKGAQGLMQLMPKTAQQLRVQNSFDPEQNLRGGLKLLRTLLSQYNSLDHALAAYNAGPVAVDKHKGIPPYQETIDYVKKVRHYYQQFVTDSEEYDLSKRSL